eukprot:s325_g12.t1
MPWMRNGCCVERRGPKKLWKISRSNEGEPLMMKRENSNLPGVEGGFGIFASGTMFPDADKIKEKVRASLFEPEVNPEDMFKTTGWCQAVARNQLFKNITMLVIVLNAIWIGVDTDLNTADLEIDSPLIFQVVDNFFCLFFSFEITVRFMAYQRSGDAFKDFSFVFDFSLVLTMIWEVWITSLLVMMMQRSVGSANMSVLRILRLFRLVRIARVGRNISCSLKSAGESRAARASVAGVAEEQRSSGQTARQLPPPPPPPIKEEEIEEDEESESETLEQDPKVTPGVTPKSSAPQRPAEPARPPQPRRDENKKEESKRDSKRAESRGRKRKRRHSERDRDRGRRGGRNHQALYRALEQPDIRVHRKQPASYWESESRLDYRPPLSRRQQQ